MSMHRRNSELLALARKKLSEFELQESQTESGNAKTVAGLDQYFFNVGLASLSAEEYLLVWGWLKMCAVRTGDNEVSLEQLLLPYLQTQIEILEPLEDDDCIFLFQMLLACAAVQTSEAPLSEIEHFTYLKQGD